MNAPQIHTIRIPTPGGFASFCEIIEVMAKSTTSSEEQIEKEKHHEDTTAPTSKLVGIPSEVSLSSTCASTACCTNDSYDCDDDGSISSISSSDEKESLLDDEDEEQEKIQLKEESPRSPRSIFKDHWQKNGVQPMVLVHETNDHHHDPHHRNMTTRNNNAMPRLPFEWEEEELKKKKTSLLLNDDNTYEKTLKLQEGVLNNNATISRRSIFGKQYQSEPTLFLSRSGTNGEIQGITPKQRTYSVPNRIGSKVPKPSCLRSSKHARSTEKQHVVFSPEVSIMKYHIPVEEWGTKGWSKWFV